MRTRGRGERRRAWRFGRFAEALCVATLRLRGYRVLARDFRSPVGEIDIVALRGSTLAFIEVKARAEPVEAVLTPRQCERIVRAAGAFLAVRPTLAGLDMRFDLMEVSPWRWPAHRRDAWRPGDEVF